MLKRFCLAMITSSLLITSAYANKDLNRIVAIVNKDIITQGQLDNLVKQQALQLRASGKEVPQAQLEKAALNTQINLSLQLQMAKQVGISVTEQQVTDAIANIAQRNNMTLAQLKTQIDSSGMDYATYRDTIHDQMVSSEVQRQAIQGQLNITPEDLNQFKQQYQAQLTKNKEYNVEDILVPFNSDSPSTAEMTQTKRKAVAILSSLEKGQTPDLNKDGATSTDLGWSSPADLPSDFLKYVATAKTNVWSQPIQAANGYHLLKVTATRSSGQKLNDEELKNALLQKKAGEAIANWLKKMRNQAYVKIMK